MYNNKEGDGCFFIIIMGMRGFISTHHPLGNIPNRGRGRGCPDDFGGIFIK